MPDPGRLGDPIGIGFGVFGIGIDFFFMVQYLLPQDYDSDAVSYSDEVNEYAKRNDILFELGFKNYRQYLRTSLWKEIRARKIALDPNCYGCGRPVEQVHHGRYHKENLTGINLKDLYSICRRCHKYCEFTRKGYKRDPIRATEVLVHIRRTRIGQKRERVDHRPRMISRTMSRR
jgi:hypothetical protein